MNAKKFILPLFRSMVTKSKLQVRWPEEPLDLPTDQCGGFYNASLGTLLSSRYEIIIKLGWGQHSSVWLAKDIKFVIVSFTLFLR